MDIVNPIASSLAQSVVAARQQSENKSDQIRRAQALRKNVASRGDDTFEHQVESTEELTPIHDEQNHERPQPQSQPRKSRPSKPRANRGASGNDAPPPQIDLTA